MRRYEKGDFSQLKKISGKGAKLLLFFLLLTAVNASAQVYNKTICSGSTTAHFVNSSAPSNETYKWVVSANTVGATNFSAGNGAPDIEQQLINTGTSSASVTYTVGAFNGGVSDAANDFTLTVTVYPLPKIAGSIAATAVCTGGTFSFNTASAVAGTSVTWTRASVSGIAGTNAGTGNIIEVLTNTTANAIATVYVVELTSTGCGFTQPISVTVNPLPSLSSTLSPLAGATGGPGFCSGSTFTYAATSLQTPVNFSWARAVVAGNASNAASSSSVNEILTNGGVTSVQVDYIFTLNNTVTGCAFSQTVSTFIKPIPVINNTASAPTTLCSGSAVTYVPTSAMAGTVFNWTRASAPNISPTSTFGTGSLNEVLTNSSATSATATYIYTVSNAGCSSTSNFPVTVNPLPTLSSLLNTGNVCSGASFAYTPTSAQSPNVIFNWTRAVVAGISNTAGSGAGAINEPLTNSTVNAINVVYAFSLSNTSTGCTNPQNVTVSVNPIPNVPNQTLTICNKNGFIIIPNTAPTGTTYIWTTPTVVTPGSINNPLPAAQAVATPYINESLLDNVTASPVDVIYQVQSSLNGCAGNSFTATITVNNGNPGTITLASSTTPPAICSGNPFAYTISGPSAPTYAWQRLQVTGISNLAASGTGNSINESLINTTISQVTTTYAVTLTVGGCSNSFVVYAAVNPGTSLNSTLTPAAICSNTTFTYSPTSLTPSTTVFGWTRAVVTGISNIANTGTVNPNEILINTTVAPITVNYIYTLETSASCVSTPQTVSVVVNPTPSLSSGLTATAICSAGVLSYVPTSATTGTLFSWNRAIASNINNASASGFNNIGETLTNTSLVPATATYVYNLTANACSNSQTVTGIVNPIPAGTNMTTAICSGSLFNTTPVSSTVPSGTNYTWATPVNVTAGAVTNGTSATGVASVSQTLNNITVAPGVINYSVTPIANGCAGTNFSVEVTVNPVPVINNFTLTSVCSGTPFTYTPPSIPASTMFTWSAASSSPPGTITGGIALANQSVITQTLTNGGLTQASATYLITPIATGCPGADFSLTVPVDPLPQVSAINTPVCSGNTFTVNPSPVPSGTTYTWALPTNTPFGSVNSVAQASPVSSISQLLTNSTTSSAQSVYNVIPVSGSCQGPSFAVTVTVNPATQLSSSLTPSAICSAGTFSYVPTSVTATTSFSWARAAIAGISNAVGAGSGNPLEILTNVTAAPLTVTYVYALATAVGCTNTQTVTVVTNPTPKMNISLTPAAVCSGLLFTYTPSSATAGTTFTWGRAVITNITNTIGSGTGAASENLVNSSLAPIQVTYNYLLAANGCSNNELVQVFINPVPVAASQALSICSNTTFTASPTGVPTGTQYTWTNPTSNPASVVNGGSAQATAQGNISQTLQNNTLAPGNLIYTPVPTANGCTGQPFTITVSVNPIPNTAPTTLAAICSGNAFSYTPSSMPAGTVYSWNSPLLSPAAGLTGGTAASLQSIISQTLNSSNNIANDAVYTVTPMANGCAGSTFDVTVPVNPTPVIGVQNIAVCSNSSFSVSPTSVPAGTTYTWATPVTTPFGAVSGSSLQSTPVALISQTLISSSNVAVQTVYHVVPATTSCTGGAFTITVAVNPGTSLSTSVTPPDICSNTVFNYPAASNTPSTNIFNWTRAAVSGISNTARSSSGNPNESLVNTTSSPVSVVYAYTLSTTAGCSNAQTVTVVVNPTPVLNPQTVNAVCSGLNIFSYSPSSATTGTTFTWSRLAVTSITNPAATGTGDPNELLVNSSLNIIPVTYDYTLAANGCSNNQSIAVNVKPTPVVIDQTAVICSNTSFSVSPANVPTGTQYTWPNATSTPTNVVTGGTAGTLQNIITGTLANTTINSGTALYTVVPAANGCTGNSFSITVTVNPIPVASSQSLTAVCSGVAFSYTPLNTPVNTKYSWGAPSLNPLQGLTGGSAASIQNAVSQTLSSNNNISNTAVYTVTPVANGCVGNTFQVTVPVNPVPVVANQSLAICSGNSFAVTPTSVPVGTQYTWAVPVQTPVGSVAGSSAQGIPQSTISQLLNNTSNAPVQLLYAVTPAVNGCSGNNFTINVGVNPGTQLSISVTPPAVCSNTQFSYPAASNTPGTIFQWTRSVVAGISNAARSGANDPLETLVNITTQSLTVTYAYTLTTLAGCTKNETVIVRINPTPSLTSLLNPAAICSGTQFNYNPVANMNGTSFAWIRSSVAFISNTASTGTNNPAEFLVNTSVNSVNTFYDYTMTASGCSNTERVTVPVSPTPVILNQTTATCTNVAFNYSPANVPASTVYTWTAPTINPLGSISGGSAEPGGQPSITQLLINQTLNAAVARYRVTPAAGVCTGADFFVDVTLNPAATISNQTLAAICSGTPFSHTPTNVPVSTVYTWSNPVISPSGGLTGGGAEAVSKAIISQTLSSSNNIVNNAVYTVTPSTNGCLGPTFTLSVFINPTPTVGNMKDTICTASSFTLTSPTPVPSNTTYTWTAPLIFPFGSVIGATPQPSPAPTISQTLFNTTTSPGQAIYTVTPQASGCVGSSFTLAVVVGAVLPAIPNQATTVCSGAAFNVTPVNLPPNTTYTWSSPTITPIGSITGASAANTPQTAVSQVLDNLIANSSSVVYTVTAKNTGCISNNFTATVTVLTLAHALVTGKPEICRYPLDTLTVTFSGTAPWGFTYFDGTTNTPHVVSGISASPYQLVVPSSPNPSRTMSFVNASHSGCVNLKDTVYFSQIINSLPVGVIHSLHGQYICNNILDTMFVTSPEVLTYQWSRNGTALAGAVDDSIATNIPGRYNVLMVNQYGCRDTAAVFQPEIYISQPVLRLTYDTYCINTLMNFTNITDTNLIGPTAWLWSFDNGTTAAGFHSSTSFTTGGDHHIQLKATQLYCPTYPTSIDTTINIRFPIPGVTMPSMSAYKGTSTPISVRNIPGYKYRWTPPFGINNPDSSNTFFNNQNTQQYVINLISPAGCVTRDSLLVRVFDDKLVEIFIPKSFTPNNDGVNDILYPYLTGIKEFKYFKIYNRFNQVMFETKNYDVGWNGSVGGTPQPMGIYIWVAVGVALDGSMVERKGQVLLLR